MRTLPSVREERLEMEDDREANWDLNSSLICWLRDETEEKRSERKEAMSAGTNTSRRSTTWGEGASSAILMFLRTLE